MQKLAGQRIVVTRAAHQAEDLADPLRRIGAEVLLLPVIGIAPPDDPEILRTAARHANDYDWIVFTSANSIAAFVAELPECGDELRAKVATVGAATREIAEQQGLQVKVTPEKYVAESLAAALGHKYLAGQRILIPSAAVTRDVVPAELRRRGALVDVVEAYRNVIPAEAASLATNVFREPWPDWVTFASSSAVENLVKLVSAKTLQHVKIATIGPITSDTVRKQGLSVAAEAPVHTIEGLVEVLEKALSHP